MAMRTNAASPAKRARFNLVDGLIFALDSPEFPWTVHCEMRVSGRLEEEPLREAAVQAARRHPLARARVAKGRMLDRHFAWDISDEPPRIPIEVADCASDDEVEEVRSRLLSRPVAIGEGPAFALALVHRPDGDSLICSLHHAAGDGLSAYRLLVSIARAYAGLGDPVPGHDPLRVRDLRGHAGSRRWKDVRDRLAGLRERVEQTRREGAPTRVAVDGGTTDAQGFAFELLRLSREETARIVASRRPPATVNDLLVASLAIAIRRFNDARGVKPRRISVMMPVNLRPSEWLYETVSNIVSFAPVTVFANEQDDLVAAQLAVADRTRAIKHEGRAGTMIDLLGTTSIWPARLRRAALSRVVQTEGVQKRLDTAVLSNLGALEEAPDFGDHAGPVTELWFSPPGRMPLGTAVGATTVNDELFLTLRYCRAQFDRAGAAELARVWRAVLLEAADNAT